jgi:hypothetical protein
MHIRKMNSILEKKKKPKPLGYMKVESYKDDWAAHKNVKLYAILEKFH